MNNKNIFLSSPLARRVHRTGHARFSPRPLRERVAEGRVRGITEQGNNFIIYPLIGFECLRTQNHFPRQGGSQTTSGFTLIELLVVVLIIGILAAVAFPKYQAAVDKASLSCIRPVLKTLTDAQQAAALARGSYPPEGSYFTFDDLDVDVQAKNEACKSTSTCRAMCANKEFEIVLRNTETWANFWWNGTGTLDRLRCVNKDTLYYLLQCSSARCKRIAKALGGKFAYGNETTENYVL